MFYIMSTERLVWLSGNLKWCGATTAVTCVKYLCKINSTLPFVDPNHSNSTFSHSLTHASIVCQYK